MIYFIRGFNLFISKLFSRKLLLLTMLFSEYRRLKNELIRYKQS